MVKAIKEGWTPNENYRQKAEMNIFNEWYEIAKKRGVVEGAMRIDGVQHVITPDGKHIPFTEIVAVLPIEDLTT